MGMVACSAYFFLPPDARSEAGAREWRPRSRRALITFLPALVRIRARKPDVRRRFLHGYTEREMRRGQTDSNVEQENRSIS